MNNTGKNKLTQKQLKKMRERSRFNVETINDFISAKNMSDFGHICDSCINKRDCLKRLGAIILNCTDYRQRFKKDYRR